MSIQINPQDAYQVLDQREKDVDARLKVYNDFAAATEREFAFFDRHLDDGYDEAHDMTAAGAEILDETLEAIKADYAQIDAERTALDNLLAFYGLSAADFDDPRGGPDA